MADIEPITREEILLNSIAEGTGSEIQPITRKEMYLSAIAGETELPADMNPITREEIFLQKVLDNGTGGGGITPTGTKQISIAQNGTTTEDVINYASAQITTNVHNSYTSSDEGKVVSSGALVSQSSQTVTENGTYDTTLKNEVVVNVSGSGGDTDVLKAIVERTASDLILPSGITSIAKDAFYNYSNLASITLPSGVTKIEAGAFQNCTSLTSITLPGSLTAIETSAFNGCGSLTSVTLPSGVTSIGSYTFSNCTSLASVTLPNGLTSIGSSAFSNCASLASVTLPNGLTSIGSSAFSNCRILTTLVLRRSDAVCALSNVNSLQNTPIRGYNSLTGKVYVPSALIESYKAATNWSTIYNEGHMEFVAIEGSEYDD